MTIYQKSGGLPRALRFLRKPWSEKKKSFYVRWTVAFPRLPMPLRLSFGAWWLVRGDNAGLPISAGRFESAEIAFVDRLLQPGMTVLDVGAHHGLYTLLSSRRVGSGGRVFCFEPSPRERAALLQHLRLNRCRNVVVEDCALGAEEMMGQLHVVDGFETGCNSLRPPTVMSTTSPVTVRVRKLDEWLSERKIDRVDFVKLDVEGGELAVLEGAAQVLERRPRPIILAEVQDVRTEPWGYRAKQIIEYLGKRKYQWFGLLPDGRLEKLDSRQESLEGNFVACPEERSAMVSKLMGTPLTESAIR
jgi:FkbM family methyltransferase